MNPTTARANFTEWRALLAENAYDADPHLRSLLAFHGREAHAEVLRPFGALVSTTLDDLARDTNRDENLPRLRRYDGQGHRTEGVEFHPGYHALGRAVYATGVMSAYREPGHETETLATMYLYSQNGEAGHACPLACTAGLIKILQAAPGDHGAWLERLYDPDYDTHFHGSQFLTEVQGGSDVGANAVVARPAGDGTWRITGEKWFCSVVDAHLFLVTARPDGSPEGTRGLGAFAVARTRPDGTPNGFAVRRLKYKLGTRSMASAEIDFDGAVAVPVGDFQRVVSVVLNTSRLYNALASAGLLQRAWREAAAYARTRHAFGRPVIGFPSAARIVAGIRTEAYAARGLSFALAALADRQATGGASEADAAAWRMLVNLNKYWTSIATTRAIRDAIEIFGGNGAIEEFTVLPRLLRDSIVCEAWEGSHNVLCAQVLRDARRLGLHEPMFAWLEALAGPHPRLTAARAAWAAVLARPDDEASLLIRDVADLLRPIAQAQALRAESRHPGSDPLLPAVIDHLLATTEPGWSALSDPNLATRIAALV